MTILRKQVLLSTVFSFTILTSMLFSMWSGQRLYQIYNTMNEGDASADTVKRNYELNEGHCV